MIPPDSTTLGISIRRPTAADADAANEVIVAADIAVVGESESTVADLHEWWKLIDLDQDGWLLDVEGRLAATIVALKHGDTFDVDGYVHPDFQGRGVGQMLLKLSEARAAELGLPRVLNACLAPDASARRLFEASGYSDARHYYRMLADLSEPVPEPEWPPGLTIATHEPEDARAFYDALNEAFADEWNFHQRPFEEWTRLRLEAENFDPTLWWIVREDDEIAAVLRAEAKRFGVGWVGALGVRRPWRKQGLGLALLRHAFRAFQARGEARVGLGVDAENSSGATRLYERAGMAIHWEAIVYEKRLG